MDLISALQPGARSSAAPATCVASCSGLTALFTGQPSARQVFLAQGGGLCLIDMLGSDEEKVQEAVLEALAAFVDDDVFLLETVCLLGVVPLLCRLAIAPWGLALRAKAASLIKKICCVKVTVDGVAARMLSVRASTLYCGQMLARFSMAAAFPGSKPPWLSTVQTGNATQYFTPALLSDINFLVNHAKFSPSRADVCSGMIHLQETIQQIFITCEGLRYLVWMLRDALPAIQGAAGSLTKRVDAACVAQTAVECTCTLLQSSIALPLNYLCRLLAQYGLAKQLAMLIKQLTAQNKQRLSKRDRRSSSSDVMGPTLRDKWSIDSSSRSSATDPLQHFHSARNSTSRQSVGSAAESVAYQSGGIANTRGSAPGAALLDSTALLNPSAYPLQQLKAATAAGPLGISTAFTKPSMPESAFPSAHSPGPASLSQVIVAASNVNQYSPSIVQPLSSATAVTAPSTTAWQGLATAAHESCVPSILSQNWEDQVMRQSIGLMLIMAHADACVKAIISSTDNLQVIIDCLQHVPGQNCVTLMQLVRQLSSEPGVVPLLRDAGFIQVLVGYLQPVSVMEPWWAHIQMEALHALFNICRYNTLTCQATA